MSDSRKVFMKVFEEKVLQKIAYLEKTYEENEELISATKNNLAARCEKMKQTKRENNVLKKNNEAMRETLMELTKTRNDFSDYGELLRSEGERLRKEVQKHQKHYQRQLEDLDQKWKEYEAQYETLPLAKVRRKEENALKKSEVELLVKQQKLADLKKLIRIRNEIDTKLRNSLVVDCVKVWQEIKLEEIQNQAILADRARLEEELRQQDFMLSELKQKKRSAEQQQESFGRSGQKRPIPSSSITSSQDRSPCEIPEFHLSHTVSLFPTPSLRKDSDSISITSSFIDSLLEEARNQTEATDELVQSPAVGGQKEDQMTQAVRVPAEMDTANPQEEEEYRCLQPENRSPKNVRFIGNPFTTDGSEKSFDLSEMMESDALDVAQGYEYSDENRGGEFPNADADRNYHVPTVEEIPDLVDDEPVRGERQRRLLNFGEPEPKIPRISSIQKVKMNMPSGKQDNEDDPLKDYMAASESNASFNWMSSRGLSSIFSNSAPDYQRGIMDTEVQSSVGSETSMQIEDIMKGLSSQLSPDQRRGSRGGDRHTNLREVGDRTEREHEVEAGPSSHSTQPNFLAGIPFLSGFRKPGAPTDPKGSKKNPFFLNMF